jgi:hypothetical protein
MGGALWLALTTIAPSGAGGAIHAVLLLGLIGGGIALYGALLSAFGVLGLRDTFEAIRQGRKRDLRG